MSPQESSGQIFAGEVRKIEMKAKLQLILEEAEGKIEIGLGLKI